MFDGRTMTRVGRLVLGGVGEHFNLMGTFPADSTFRVATEYTSSILDEIHRQAGSRRLSELPEYSEIEQRYGEAEEVEFSNYGMFYQLGDLIKWLLIHDAGCFPSTLESIIRRFGQGNVRSEERRVGKECRSRWS